MITATECRQKAFNWWHGHAEYQGAFDEACRVIDSAASEGSGYCHVPLAEAWVDVVACELGHYGFEITVSANRRSLSVYWLGKSSARITWRKPSDANS